ncbi:lysophospholipase D GDPD3a isoform X2 [Hypomesus transpacificus]|uniref:lysophospholipase D GDPD3a isoform X2 n=1 Tax=Hypomesus transpacificus TaxID=137520 RepID=UPI001F07583A|nr:lysophospholipase D GDPD3a isoform X2 [Hypomesus transpacificus]
MENMSSSLYFIIPALGGYTLTSLYLLKNPHILHRKRRTAFNCTHISHRGGSGERIESTMEAFSHAVQQGTEMLEMDCHLTRDGHVVVSHDENLLRQTGQDVTISSLSLEEMPLYKERMEVTFFAGHYSTGTDRKFALLEDVFRMFPNMPINIEIKEENTMLIQKNTNMPYSFSISRGMQLLLLFYSGLLPFVPLGESFLQFYLPRIINRTYIPEERILKSRLVISFIEKLTMRKSLLKHLVSRGIQVHLFVCNEEQDITAAFKTGATGVMTDYPTLLSNYLSRQRNQD